MEQRVARILIADDEPGLLNMMRVYLQRRGYAVDTADSADAAMKILEPGSERYEAVVLDATIQGQSSMDVAKRALAAGTRTAVIVISGYPIDITSLKSAGAGRVAFLLKPFSPEMLVETVRRLIGPEEKV